ncbi:MAG: TonB-dependent receptor [Proteobacteria bacterium]|nr:TonB-dependent receptor [Pseudomonadota bacterium]
MAALGAAGATHAAQAAAAPAASGDIAVGEVIVTAQKREQNLQNVPVVVTALSARQLRDAGVHDIKDLTVLTPGLTVTSTGSEGSTTARIRGVGTVSDNIGLEDSVGVVIDGVYRPRNGVAFNDLGELSDIEVLKGPQGTLFGKNTTAGVIQITTLRPKFVFGAEGEATFSNYNGYGGSVSVTGPIAGDKLAGRLYIADRQRDGYYNVSAPTGSDVHRPNDQHMFTVRGQLLWQPTSDFDVNFIADYTKRNDHCCAAVPIQTGAAAGLLNTLFGAGTTPNPANPKSYTAFLNRDLVENIRDEGVSAEAHWKTPWLNNATLTSITAYREWHNQGGGDTDATAADLLFTPNDNFNSFKQFSEELRYAGSTSRLDWMVGAFFSHETLDQRVDQAFGSDLDTFLGALTGGLPLLAGFSGDPFPVGKGSIGVYHQVEHSESVFTQESFKVTDQLELTGGIRYTHEHKALSSFYDNTDNGAACAYAQNAAGTSDKAVVGLYCLTNPAFNNLTDSQRLSEETVTGTVKAAYRFNRDLMVYGSYSRGYLVGGFNLAAVTTQNNSTLTPELDTSFQPEHVNAFEIGEKATLLDRRMTLNAAVFYQDYRDFQLNAFTGTEFIVTSIPQVVSKGVEVDVAYNPVRGLLLNGGLTYADTYYPNSAKNRAVLQAPGSPLNLLPGQRVSLAPLWSLTGGVSYTHPLVGDVDWKVATDAKFVTSYNTGSDLDPNKVQKDFTLVNARVGIAAHNGGWAVELWATNLFNQYYKQVAFDGVYQTFSSPLPNSVPSLNTYYAFLGQPRMFGATLRVKY